VKACRVCIEARVTPEENGGVAQVVLGLAAGLGALRDGDEEYLFLGDDRTPAWLEGHIGPNGRIVLPPGRVRSYFQRALRDPLRAWQGLPPMTALLGPQVVASDGCVETAGAGVVHFPYQYGFRTRIPTIYHPHDLQHVHLPEYFSASDRRDRERFYGTLCRQAAMVAVASSWVKRDVESHFQLPPERVRVVPLAPANLAYPVPTEAELAALCRRLELPASFALYPARTWPHKNHLGAVEAVAHLRRSRGLEVPLVFSGGQSEHAATVIERARALGVQDLVRFVGHVTPLDLQCLYRLARVVVVPSRFEAASFPVWEAHLAGVPVACSNVTSLPLQAGDAALLFDPDRTEEMAVAVERLWVDPVLRAELVCRGHASVARFTWKRTARIFRAHYRRLAGWPLTGEDAGLLAEPPIM